jgi:hypothetical protein
MIQVISVIYDTTSPSYIINILQRKSITLINKISNYKLQTLIKRYDMKKSELKTLIKKMLVEEGHVALVEENFGNFTPIGTVAQGKYLMSLSTDKEVQDNSYKNSSAKRALGEAARLMSPRDIQWDAPIKAEDAQTPVKMTRTQDRYREVNLEMGNAGGGRKALTDQIFRYTNKFADSNGLDKWTNGSNVKSGVKGQLADSMVLAILDKDGKNIAMFVPVGDWTSQNRTGAPMGQLIDANGKAISIEIKGTDNEGIYNKASLSKMVSALTKIDKGTRINDFQFVVGGYGAYKYNDTERALRNAAGYDGADIDNEEKRGIVNNGPKQATERSLKKWNRTLTSPGPKEENDSIVAVKMVAFLKQNLKKKFKDILGIDLNDRSLGYGKTLPRGVKVLDLFDSDITEKTLDELFSEYKVSEISSNNRRVLAGVDADEYRGKVDIANGLFSGLMNKFYKVQNADFTGRTSGDNEKPFQLQRSGRRHKGGNQALIKFVTDNYGEL